MSDRKPPHKLNQVEIQADFHGGITLSTSAVKNALLACIELGIVSKTAAVEISQMYREASKELQENMFYEE